MDLSDGYLTAVTSFLENSSSLRSSTNHRNAHPSTSRYPSARVVRVPHTERRNLGAVKVRQSRTQKPKDKRKTNVRQDKPPARSIPIQKRRYSRPMASRSTVRTECPTRSSNALRTPRRSYSRRVSSPVGSSMIQSVETVTTPCTIPAQNSAENSVETIPARRSMNMLPKSRSTWAKRRLSRSVRRKDKDSTAGKTDSDPSLYDRHEAFVKSFAIPTHLYRYLAQRHRQRPLYLDRTLSYMRSTPPPFNSYSQSSVKPKSSRSIHSVAERLFQQQQQKMKLSGIRNVKKTDVSSNPPSLIKDLSSPSFWPHEVQLNFEGFFDSEKELDWITVEASVGLHFRFGSAWRHKPTLGDTIVAPFSAPFPLTCFNPVSGLEHCQPNSASLDCCSFQPLELLTRAKWLTSGGRLNSGQLELRVSAVERRWLKRPDPCRANSTVNVIANGVNPTPRSGATANRKAGLSSSAYPVHYSTAPLPLFYPINISNTLSESRPFLLSPGLYELRLGVDHDEHYTADRLSLLADCPDQRRTNLCNGYYDTGSTAESVVTSSSSDFPNGTVCLIDDIVGINEAGAASGRVEWRRIRFPNSSVAVDEYTRWPRLQFRVTWHGRASEHSDNSQPSSVEVKKSDSLNGTLETRLSSLRSGTPLSCCRPSPKSVLTRCLTDPLKPPTPSSKPCTNVDAVDDCPVPPSDACPAASKPVRPRKSMTRPHLPDPTCLPDRPVTYRFLYMGQLQQWSESRDLVCPWCHLDCWRARERGPEALLVHLRTCHPRFRFKAAWSPSRSHLSLEVSLNEAYDGSNDCGLRRWSCGIASNLGSRRFVPPGQLIGGWTGLGLASASEGRLTSLNLIGSLSSRVPCPIRRLPYTHLIFWRGADRAIDQPLDPTLSVRPVAVGHNRVYYHTRSVQPIRACEFDIDSEAEDAPNWLRQHYQRKVEEFTDVNQGEKQIMQLWNALLLSISPSELVVCDTQVANLASCFIHRYALVIHRRRLRNNLLLHFANLVDYGLLSAGQMRQLITTYDRLVISGRG